MAELDVVFSAACMLDVALTATGTLVSTCATGTTCNFVGGQGKCVNNSRERHAAHDVRR